MVGGALIAGGSGPHGAERAGRREPGDHNPAGQIGLELPGLDDCRPRDD
jgi:hypothetical protein